MNHERPIREVLDESQQVFEQLLAAIESLPEQAFTEVKRYLPWWEGSSLTSEAFFDHFHEEHEPDMRAWLAQMKKQ